MRNKKNVFRSVCILYNSAIKMKLC